MASTERSVEVSVRVDRVLSSRSGVSGLSTQRFGRSSATKIRSTEPRRARTAHEPAAAAAVVLSIGGS